jgi:hypothetical protein
MAKFIVTVRCWDHGHETKDVLTAKQAERLHVNVLDGKVTCPVCKGSLAVINGPGLFDDGKLIQCASGHLTVVTAFANKMLHLQFGNGNESFVNVEGTPEEFDDLLDKQEIICYHTIGEGSCDAPLKAIDDKPLQLPRAAGIKTKTRIGDIWDKHRVEPVRSGNYDGDGNYQESKTDKANRQRLNRMRRQRNIAEDKHPGKRINKPTDQIHDRRSKGDLDIIK